MRSLVLGSLTGNPDAERLRQLATLLDLFPVMLFPTLAAPADWFARLCGAPQLAARIAMLVLFSLTMLGGFTGVVLAFRRGDARTRRALALGTAWLLPQLGVYVITGYYSPRHAYSAQFSWSLLMIPALFCGVQELRRSRPLTLALIGAWLAPLTLLWLGTGPATSAFAGPVAASRLHRSFLAELERSLPADDPHALIFAVNYPAFTLGNDDYDRFSAASPTLFLKPLGHAVLPMEGATRWLKWRHARFDGQVRTLLVSTSAAGVARLPITIERKPDRVVVSFAASQVQYNLSKTVDHVASLGSQQELLIQRARLGKEATHARIFVWDGVQGSLEPFPDVLEIRLDPEVRGPLYWQTDPRSHPAAGKAPM
ncbi:MAG: hypothetical protein U1E76_00300 [Planctomycetota bacterium]